MHDRPKRTGSLGALVVCALGLVFTAPPVYAECPALRMSLLDAGVCGSVGTSTIPAYYYFEDHCLADGYASVIYDHIAGTLSAYSTSLNDHLFETSVWSLDDFVIEGPANPDRINLTVLFTFNLSTFSEASLWVGPDTVRSQPVANQTLRLDLHLRVDEHFLVGLFERTFPVRRRDEVTGQLSFASLPPGYTLRSCYGFAPLPVGVRATSWARVKQIYR